jgi:hypothetical protein
MLSPIKPEEPSAWLDAIRNPMIFNAFAILMGFLTLKYIPTPSPERWSLLGFIASVTVFLNGFAAINPRFLNYGGKEYLRESEMSHERIMAGKQ